MTYIERRPGANRGDANDQLESGQADGIPAQLRRRRAASYRCTPLADGRRDPLHSVHEPLTDAELDSWRAAWHHLHALGLPAVVPERVLAAAGSRAA